MNQEAKINMSIIDPITATMVGVGIKHYLGYQSTATAALGRLDW